MHKDIKEVLITEEEIAKRVEEIGAEITRDYKDKDLLVIGILKGAVTFMSDLIRKIDLPLKLDYMVISSYGSGTTTSGEVKILKDLDTRIEGRNILIVEDIIDTGLTLSYLIKNLESRGAKTVTIVTLLNKKARRKRDIFVKYIGYDIADEFVIGYGLDYDENYRNLPYVGLLKEDVYS